MYMVNRSAAVIKPKQPFVDWLNSIPDSEKLTLKQVSKESMIVLIPEFDHQKQVDEYLRQNFTKIFENQLEGWCLDESQYPKKQDWSLFQEWFDLELCSEVFDMDDDSLETEDL